MSIRAVTYSGTSLPLIRTIEDRACFGFMAGTSNNHVKKLGWIPQVGSSIGSNFRRLHPEESGPESAAKLELMAILEEVPMFSGFSVVDPQAAFNALELIVDTTLPADQIILSYFFLRNLTHYTSAVQEGYIWLRLNSDLNRATCLLLSNLFTRKKTLTSFESEETRWSRVPGQNEPSPIHFDTFGKISFNAFAKQTEDYAPWLQAPMVERGGYKRDSHYSSGDNIQTNLGADRVSVRSNPHRVQQYMASALTISTVEVPLHEGVGREWRGSDGEFLAKVSEILDEDIHMSEELREQIRWNSLTPVQKSEELSDNPTYEDGSFREGVQVTLSESGKAKYGDTTLNPHNSVGFLTCNRLVESPEMTNPFVYLVRWESSNVQNSYCADDLELSLPN